MHRRRLFSRDDGVNEVIGFILAFAVSAIILIVSTHTFTRARENTEAVITGVELRGIANRVAARVTQAGVVAQELPNATMTFRIKVSEDFSGKPYIVEAGAEHITATTQDGLESAQATLYRLNVVPHVTITGDAVSSPGWLEVRYEYTRVLADAGGFPETPNGQYHQKEITITNG